MDSEAAQLLEAALGSEVLPAAELVWRMGFSPGAFQREVRRLGHHVLTLGRGRARRYALAREAGLTLPVPVAQVDAAGQLQLLAELFTIGRPISAHLAWVGTAGAPSPVEVFDGLPWFMAGMRPRGFMGRSYPRRVLALALPPRLADWDDRHILRALAQAGSDAPGDLIAGREAIDRFLALPATPPPLTQAGQAAQASKAAAYDALAEASLQGEPVGPPVGGGQPKFTAWAETSDGPAHVIVKFSPTGSDAPARRWRDLMRAECHAQAVLREGGAAIGVQACAARLVEGAQRLFLEVPRFDRVGAHGRHALVAMGVADDEFVGQCTSWAATAAQLQLQRRLSPADAASAAGLQAFGQLIQNTGMHFDNLSLFMDGPPGPGARFALAPAYGMQPMRYAPTAQGLPPLEWQPPMPRPDTEAVWPGARVLAGEFWARVAADVAISEDMQQLAREAQAWGK